MIRHGLLGAGKLAAISVAMAAALAMPLSASARGWGGHGYHGGNHSSYRGGGGSYGGYHGGYYGHGGYWSGGRWIAGAIVTGAVVGLVADALNPRPVYYGPPVVYNSPGVVYSYGPPVERRVVVTRTVTYEDPQQAQYIRDDGYDGN